MALEPHVAPFTHAHYRCILQSALDSGYAFISFPGLQDVVGDGELVCLLRHDCDNDLVAAAEISRLEEALGVRSTYFLMLRSAMYNLLSVPNAELVREIVGRGHWVGLHFDEHYYQNLTPAEISACVDQERDWLSNEFGVPVDVVSFHQPSQRVLDEKVTLRCINTYDRRDLPDVHYLSDSNTVWTEGCPSHLFRARRYRRVQLLLHPEWWTPEEMTVPEKWNQMLRHNFALMQKSLLARERAYRMEQAITFLPTQE